MKKRILTSLTIAMCFINTVDAAHKKPSPWAGSNANIGYNLNTGDTQTQNLNIGLTTQYASPEGCIPQCNLSNGLY